MTPQELSRFETYARSCGYSTNKEGGRYCQGIVNQLKDAWFASLHQASAAPAMAVCERSHYAQHAQPSYGLYAN